MTGKVMKRMHVLMLSLSEIARDPRIRRIAGSLVSQGHTVTVISMKGESASAEDWIDGFRVLRADPPASYTDADMAAIGNTCGAAFEIIRRCDPRIAAGIGTRHRHWAFDRALDPARALGGRLLGRPAPLPSGFRERLAIRSILLLNHAMVHLAKDVPADLIYANDLDTLLAGFMLKSDRQVPLAYDAHEIYPEQFAPQQRAGVWHRFYTRLEANLVRHTDVRFTVCQSIADYFARTYDAPGFITIRNCPVRALIGPEPESRPRGTRRTLLYHGAYFPYRGLDEVILAMRNVPSADVIFRGLGAHEAHLRQLVGEHRLGDRIRFAPPVAVDALIANARPADIGLNPFISVCLNTEYALPNKFFEYMAAGLAMLSADLVEMRNLTRELGLGWVYDSAREDLLTDTLLAVLADEDRIETCRQNAWKASIERFHWEHEESSLLRALGDAT